MPSSESAVSMLLAARIGQRVDGCSDLEILVCQLAASVMRGEFQRHLLVADEHIGMVVEALGDGADSGCKRQPGHITIQLEGLGQFVAMTLPVIELFQTLDDFRFIQSFGGHLHNPLHYTDIRSQYNDCT